MPVAQHRIGEEVVGTRWMMRGGLEPDTGPARAGHGEERRRDPGVLEGPKRQLCRGRKAPRSGERLPPLERLSRDIGQRIRELRQQLRRRVRSIEALGQRLVRGPEVGRDVDDELAGGQELPRHLPRLPMLKGEKDHVGLPRRLHGCQRLEGGVGEGGELGMDLSQLLPRLAPAGRHNALHLGMTEEEADQLAAGVPGGPDDSDPHAAADLPACQRRTASRAHSTSPSACFRALNAGTPREALM